MNIEMLNDRRLMLLWEFTAPKNMTMAMFSDEIAKALLGHKKATGEYPSTVFISAREGVDGVYPTSVDIDGYTIAIVPENFVIPHHFLLKRSDETKEETPPE